jgi:hypothetical protein
MCHPLRETKEDLVGGCKGGGVAAHRPDLFRGISMCLDGFRGYGNAVIFDIVADFDRMAQ